MNPLIDKENGLLSSCYSLAHRKAAVVGSRPDGRRVLKAAGTLPKCAACKTVMEKDGQPRLFLIPVFHDHDYTASPAYYEQNCTPIRDIRDIPTGQRACRFWWLACPACGGYKILMEDFLQVRDKRGYRMRQVLQVGQIILA